MLHSIPLGSLSELWESRGEGMNRLTVTQARALKKQGMYRADPTLYLNVAPGGSKSWIQRLTIRGKRHDIGLGSFELVTMAEARDKAFRKAQLVNRMRHLVTAAARQARSLAPGARPTRWNQLR